MFTDSGKTILFVSHNRMDILELSNKCIWLDKGRIKKMGEPTEVLGEYFAMHRDNFDAQKTIIDIHTPHTDSDGTLHLHWSEADAPGNDVLSIHELTVQSALGKLFSSEPVEIKFVIDKKKSGVQIGAFFFLEDVFYQPVMVSRRPSKRSVRGGLRVQRSRIYGTGLARGSLRSL